MSGELVLVTGGSGFIGAHCVVRLLDAGYRVRATVRSPDREPDVRAMVAAGRAATQAAGLPATEPADLPTGPAAPSGADERASAAAPGRPRRNVPGRDDSACVDPGQDDPTRDDLTFVAADLGADDGWTEAVAGCDYVLHVASPFPPGEPDHEDELIVPAREGALRVLRAARDAGVRRVVLTSSFGAVGYGHPQSDELFTEESWTNVDAADVSAYVKSKTLAERAAWEFAAREGGGTELTVVNPVGVFGPVLGPDYSASIGLIRRLLDGGMPGAPRMYFATVDVRDVADLHLLAMTSPAAAGERFVAAAGDVVSLHDVAVLLRARLGADAARVPTGELPDDSVRLSAGGKPGAAGIPPNLGTIRHTSSEKARRVLGWAPRSNEEALLATAESLVRLAGRRE